MWPASPPANNVRSTPNRPQRIRRPPLIEVLEDRREGDGRDHQLEPGQEHANPEDGEQDERGPSGHGRECSGEIRLDIRDAGRVASTSVDINRR